jgi:hypothetical protein
MIPVLPLRLGVIPSQPREKESALVIGQIMSVQMTQWRKNGSMKACQDNPRSIGTGTLPVCIEYGLGFPSSPGPEMSQRSDSHIFRLEEFRAGLLWQPHVSDHSRQAYRRYS